MRTGNIAVTEVIIGMAAPAAKISGPATPAFFFVIQVIGGKLPLYPCIYLTRVHIPHIKMCLSHELVTGIDIAFRSDGQVIDSTPAAAAALG
jgi:hypothetical protein